MSKAILEKDLISVNILVTDDLFPLPYEAIINENLGKDNVIVTNDSGEVTKVVNGKHMIIELEAKSFVEWINYRSFWMFDSEDGQYKHYSFKRNDDI